MLRTEVRLFVHCLNEDEAGMSLPFSFMCTSSILAHTTHTHRGVAVPLVNAFAIPDHILRAPIGLAGSGVSDMYKEYLLAAGFDV